MRYRCSVLLILTVLSTSLTGVIVGYDLCVIANVLGDIKKDYKLCNAEARASTDPNPAAGSTKKPSLGCIRSTLVVSALAPGAVIGSLGAGFFADAFGRRASVILADVLFMAGSLCFLIGGAYWCILLGRVFLGAGVGVGFVVFSTYVPEISPDQHRGKLVAIQDGALSLGCFLSYGITALVSTEHWPQIVGSLGAIALVQAITAAWLPESPRWLVQKGRKKEAIRTLLRLTPKAPFIKNEDATSHADDTAAAAAAVSDDDHRVMCTMMVEAMEADIEAARQLHRRMRGKYLASRGPSKPEPGATDHYSSPTARLPRHSSASEVSSEALSVALAVVSSNGSALNGVMRKDSIADMRRNSLSVSGKRLDAEAVTDRTTTLETSRLASSSSAAIVDTDGRKENFFEPSPLKSFLLKWRLGLHSYADLCWEYRVPIGVAVGCAVAQNLTLGNTIISYTAPLLKTADIPAVKYLSVGIGLAKFLGIMSATLLVDYVGRRPLLFLGSVTTFLCHILFAVFFGLRGKNVALSFAGWGILVVLYIFILAWNLSWAGLMFVVASEVLPSVVRGIGISLTIAMFWSLAFIFQLTIGLLSDLLTLPGAFAFFAATNFLSILFVVFCVKDLTKVPLEHVAKAYVED